MTSTDPQIQGVLAGLATSDMERPVRWLGTVLGRPPTARPMEILADWSLGDAGTIQLVLDPERAGGSIVTLHVADIAATRDRLAADDITLEVDDTSSERVKFGVLRDPDANSVTVVEALPGFDPENAG